MYAVIANGGKQYRVSEGQLVKLEKIALEPGQKVEFDKILMVADGENIQLGTPYINGFKVRGEVIRQGRDKKIRIVKFRRRKHHMKLMGHRQDFTEVKIIAIGEGNGSAKSQAQVEMKAEKASTKPAAKKTVKKPNKK
jgi:large subunit ribosomal protein L21